MSATRRLVELSVLGGAAVVMSAPFLYLFFGAQEGLVEGSPMWRLVLGITYLAVTFVLLPWYREMLLVLRRNWALVLLLVLAVLSSFWAQMPDLVLRKSVGLLGTTLFGMALAIRLSVEEQLRMFSWLFRIVALFSIAFVVLLPSYGISSEGEWVGVFGYKNAMGASMGLAFLVEWQLPAADRLSKALKMMAMLLYLILLLHSDSITPLVALACTIILITIYKYGALSLRIPLYAFSILIALLVTLGGAFVLANGDRVIGLLGRSATLTGRTEIWSFVISFIPQRPILGYGYSGFWQGAAPESFVINRYFGGPVQYSHNGYLEVLLTLGLVGLLLTLIFLGIGLKRAFYVSRQRPFGVELWPLAFLLYFALHNLGEVYILMQDLEWAMCVSCIVGADLLLLACRDVEDVEEDDVPLTAVGEPG
jgi:exopolysaccharide production protein ExoQ